MSLILSTVVNTWPDHLGPIALKAATLLATALVCGLVLRRVSAARRHVLWLSTVLAVGAVTIATPLLPAWRVLPAREEPPMRMPPSVESDVIEEEVAPLPRAHTTIAPPPAADGPAVPPAPTPTAIEPAITWREFLACWPGVWMAVVLVLLARLFVSAWRLRMLEKRCLPGESAPRLMEALRSALRESDVISQEKPAAAREGGPLLLIGPDHSVPMVWGIVRQRLLLPADASDWPDEKLRAVLVHELAHLRRRDPFALLLAQLMQAAHWFNPLAWLTVRCLRADQERACDDAVLRQGVPSSSYAQHLLDIARHHRLAPGLGLCSLAMARPAPVERRLAAILDPRIKRDSAAPRSFLIALSIAALISTPLSMVASAAAKAAVRGRILDRNGIVLAESTDATSRRYPLKALAAHVIGYTGRTGPHDATPTGRSAMERFQNEILSSGRDVTLTLDARIQSLAVRAMREGGVTRGAVVVLDPRDGGILAAASLPDFDLNLFVPSISLTIYDRLAKDRAYPLFDRCFSAEYPPASAIAPLTALAGISAGLGEQSYECTGSVPFGTKKYLCWKSDGHGTSTMSEAIVRSCNCYWYKMAIAAGPEAIAKVGGLVGFGHTFGVTDREATGDLPSPEWLRNNRPKERWTDAATANTAIGQGWTTVTPLQLAVLAATIGNGGRVPQPVLVRDGTPQKWRADLVAEGLAEQQIGQIREGMRQVVWSDNGTGKQAQSAKVVIAGKTGTAQYWRSLNNERITDDRCWFIGFAPFEKPTLAFAVLMEGGNSGGKDCAPIARRIVEEALALPADGSGKVEPVDAEEVRKAESAKGTAGSKKVEIESLPGISKKHREAANHPDGKPSPPKDVPTSGPPRSRPPRSPAAAPELAPSVFAPQNLVPRKRNLLAEAQEASSGKKADGGSMLDLGLGLPPQAQSKAGAYVTRGTSITPFPTSVFSYRSSATIADSGPPSLARLISLAKPNAMPEQDAANDPLLHFLKSRQEKPGSFEVSIRRAHYFDDEVPDREGKDCFAITPSFPTHVGFAFVPKTTALAADLGKKITWGDKSPRAKLELQWRESDGKEWIEIIAAVPLPTEKASPPSNPDSVKDLPLPEASPEPKTPDDAAAAPQTAPSSK